MAKVRIEAPVKGESHRKTATPRTYSRARLSLTLLYKARMREHNKSHNELVVDPYVMALSVSSATLATGRAARPIWFSRGRSYAEHTDVMARVLRGSFVITLGFRLCLSAQLMCPHRALPSVRGQRAAPLLRLPT